MPVLITTPLSSADTGEGATGWASGSQMWSGTRPALEPNPIKARVKATGPTPDWPKSGVIAKKAIRKKLPRWVATR